MANELVELTQVKITSGKMTGGFKKLIALEYIFSIEPGAQDTALITLANGEKIVVKETYNELKARFGVKPLTGGAANGEALPDAGRDHDSKSIR